MSAVPTEAPFRGADACRRSASVHRPGLGDELLAIAASVSAKGCKCAAPDFCFRKGTISHATHDANGRMRSLADLQPDHQECIRRSPSLQCEEGLAQDAAYEKVPTAIQLARHAATKEMFRLYRSKFAAAYPFFPPAGVSAERIAALQGAFDAVMKDPAFARPITGYGMRLRPIGGAALKRLVKQANTAPEVIRTSMKEAPTR